MDAITIKDVTFSYSSSTRPSIENIDLTVKQGEVVVLCGQSGCGKTTVIRLINALVPFFYPGDLNGDVTVMGKHTTRGTIYDIGSLVGTVFQNPRSQFFCVDVMSELAFGAENRKIEKSEILQRIDKAAGMLEIDSLLDRTMFQLSGGEKQKIACACVSVTDNPVVVMDEPSSNLDSAAISELKKIIIRWKNQGKTVVLAEHRLEYLKDIADRFVYMKDGRIDEIFTSKELKNLPEEELEKRSLRTLNYERLKPCAELKSDENLELRNFHFRYRGSDHPGLSIDSLSIPKGSVIGIIGRNGAGKSTFMRTFCGLERRSRGVLIEDNRSYPGKKRINRSFLVMQDVNHQLFTESVDEEVSLSMESPDSDRLDEILDEFDLAELRDRHPMALSGGQKQRVAVASAVASGRDFIVFDEPTSGLDLVHMHQVADCMLNLQSLGRTVLLITHDIELIYECCGFIVHMEDGKVKDSYPLNDRTEYRLRNFFCNGN